MDVWKLLSWLCRCQWVWANISSLLLMQTTAIAATFIKHFSLVENNQLLQTWWTLDTDAIRKNGTRQTTRQQTTETGRWLKATPVGRLQSLASHWLLNVSINLCLPAWLHPHSKGAVLSQMHLNLSYWRQLRRPGPFGQQAPKWAILTSTWEIGEKWY